MRRARSPAGVPSVMSSRVASRRALLLPAAATLVTGTVVTSTLPLPALAQTRQRPAKGGATTPPPQGSPASTPLGPLDTLARQALIIDYDTGAVLLEKNADDRMHPSSMSKLMTAVRGLRPAEEGQDPADPGIPGQRARLADGRQQDVRPARQHGAGRGAAARRHRAIRQRRLHRPGRGHQRLGAAIRRIAEPEGQGDRPDEQHLPQRHRLARPRAPDDLPRPGAAGQPDHRRLPGLLSHL